MNAIEVRRARLYEVAIPLSEPFRISHGTLEVRHSLVVQLEDERGTVGYGESAPFALPFYSDETVASARTLLSELLLPRMVDHPVAHPAELARVLSQGVVGNRMARAGVETAWWDLQAGRAGVSLASLVTDRLRQLRVAGRWCRRFDRIQCGLAIGIPTDRTLKTVEQHVTAGIAQGYHRIKLKIEPGWDIEPVLAAKAAIEGCDRQVPLTADANGAFNLDEHFDTLRRLDQLGLLYLEQPLPAESLWDLRGLTRSLKTSVCLDESLTSEMVARQIIDMDGPRVWNIKIQRVGGLEEACRIYAHAVKAGIAVWGGTMPETGIGAQFMLALGCHRGFIYPSDLEPSDRWYAAGRDPVALRMEADGTMLVPQRRPEVTPTGDWQLVTEIA